MVARDVGLLEEPEESLLGQGGFVGFLVLLGLAVRVTTTDGAGNNPGTRRCHSSSLAARPWRRHPPSPAPKPPPQRIECLLSASTHSCIGHRCIVHTAFDA